MNPNAGAPDVPLGTPRDPAYEEELCDLFEGRNLFADFSREQIKVFSRYSEVLEAAKGTTLFEEGRNEQRMYLVVDCKVDIFKKDASYAQRKLATVHPGKTLGEMSVIDGLPHSASAVIASAGRLLCLSKAQFDAFSSVHPDLALKLLMKIAKLVSLRLRRTTGMLADYLEEF